MGTEVEDVDILAQFFGRELCKYDREAISLRGMPKFKVGTRVKIHGSMPDADGYVFITKYMFWSDLLHSWVYYVPGFDFYQCESNLKEI